MTHSFHFDPNAVLGIASGASLREIRDAYHQKSLKYHPDKGGDEWAFRLVTRAYEILSTARVVDRAEEEERRPSRSTHPPHEPQPKATWASGFGPSAAKAEVDPESIINLKGGAARRGRTPGSRPLRRPGSSWPNC